MQPVSRLDSSTSMTPGTCSEKLAQGPLKNHQLDMSHLILGVAKDLQWIPLHSKYYSRSLATPFTLTHYVLYSQNIRVPAHCYLPAHTYLKERTLPSYMLVRRVSAHCYLPTYRLPLQYPYIQGTSLKQQQQNSRERTS